MHFFFHLITQSRPQSPHFFGQQQEHELPLSKFMCSRIQGLFLQPLTTKFLGLRRRAGSP